MRLTEGDSDRAIEFFKDLYRRCEGGRLEVRCLHPQLPAQSDWFPLGACLRALDFSEERNASGYDCFFGVNPRVRWGQHDKDVLAGVALWADIDGLETIEAAEQSLDGVLRFPLKIDAAVFSGNGLHVYSFLREPIDPAGEDWGCYCRALKAYAKQFGGDSKCVNVSRVLRFPLSWSHKRGRQTLLWLRGDG